MEAQLEHRSRVENYLGHLYRLVSQLFMDYQEWLQSLLIECPETKLFSFSLISVSQGISWIMRDCELHYVPQLASVSSAKAKLLHVAFTN